MVERPEHLCARGAAYTIVVEQGVMEVLLAAPIDPAKLLPLRKLLSAARDAGLDVRVRIAPRALVT